MPNSSSSPRPSPLSHDNAPVTATATDTATPRRMFFEGPIPPPLGKAVDREGIKRATPNKPAIIPTNTPTFKFTAGFSKCKTGYYVVRWRVKLLDGFSIPNGLRFSVSVSYSAEQDIKSSMDVVMLPEDLKDQPKNRSYDLELEELAVIHPHEGDATVEVIMASRESRVNHQYSGFQVESVEFKLFTGSSESQPTAATGDAIKKLIVKRATEPSCNIDGSTIDCSMIGTQGPPFTPPITRLAWSEDSTFLAALSLWKDIACITVWDMSHIRNPKDTSNLQWHRAKAIVRNENGKEFDNLSIGLAISPKGDQVAIYHQPRIGEWKSGTKVEKCLFQFSLLNNPLVHHSTRTDSIVHMNEEPKRSELERLSLPHLVLKNFTGYGAFLMEKEERNWETFDTNNALSSSVGKCTPGRTPSSARTLFAACNGLDLDVFKIGHSDLKWTHIHSITITDLTPMLNRRITCKMMMEMITSNRFMWLESGGLCCTVWDLQKGSNVSYISSIDKTKFSGLTFRGNTRMAISPDQSLAALTSADGILTTYYTNTGIAIDRKEFTGHKIEYVGFHNHSYQLFVIIRDNISLELTSWILDPLQLESKMAAKEVPIPNIGKTIHTFFRKGYFQNKGLVCEAYGSKVHCYVSYEHPAFNVQIHDGTKVRTTEAVYQVQGKRYSVRPKTHREQVGDGNGSMYWVLSVQVFENDHPEPIFSFVPEPWMRVSTRDVPLTDDLLKAYFLPGGPRFVVTGVQSVQIWELPTEKNNSCSLEFIWSRPMLEVKEGRKYKREPVGNHYQDFDNASIHVDSATGDAVAVVQMEGGRKTHVNIPSTRGSYPQAIFLSCARSIHLLAASYMFASQKNGTMVDEPAQDKYAKAILRFTQGHINRLLSASDYYPHSGEPVRGDGAARVSLSERKDTPGQGNYDTMTPPQSPMQANFRNAGYLPQLEDFGISTSANDAKAKSKWNKDPGWTAVDTVLTLLLKPKELKDANHTFIEKILNTDDGAWVPHANKDLNLIARAIELKNEQLLKTLIDYCIKKAENHPLYLVPVDQCLSELLVPYPDMVAEIFRRASYIPAPNHAYVAIGASRSFLDLVHYRTRSNPLYGVFGKISWKTPKIEDCQSPVFALRSQLPISPSLLRGVNSISRQFPTNQDEEPDKIPYGTIYVCPFQFLPTPRSFRGFFDRRLQKESVFAQMAGKDFFDSPAVAAQVWPQVLVYPIRCGAHTFHSGADCHSETNSSLDTQNS
ncbi:MAG: hypothetical protein J3Q66DRAFT_98450 [Benniella sp.]|nr:MAG: hypothetical protein J3Q66DRAFT_98450 [Benniella sp.]